jgi:hypothetical protein
MQRARPVRGVTLALAVGFGLSLSASGQAVFEPPVDHLDLLGALPSLLQVADFDADGFDDVLISDAWTSVLHVMSSDGTDFAVTDTLADSGPVRVADVTGDGVVDVVIAGWTGLSTAPGRPGAGFDPLIFSPYDYVPVPLAGPNAGSLSLHDVDGDGLLDAIVSAAILGGFANPPVPYSNQVQIYPGEAGGTFGAPTFHDDAAEFQSMEATTGDFDGDGEVDIAYVLAGASTLRVLQGLPGGGFQQVDATVPPGLAIRASEDFNGDGLTDLLLREIGGYDWFAVLATGSLSFGAPIEATPGVELSRLEPLGDFDGDGHADLGRWRRRDVHPRADGHGRRPAVRVDQLGRLRWRRSRGSGVR